MNWAGQLLFGESWALYRGLSAHNTLHEHAAIQIVFAHSSAVVITDCDGEEHSGAALAIRPMVSHALSSRGEVSIIYVEPQSPLAFAVAGCISDADIAILGEAPSLGFAPAVPLDVWASNIARHISGDNSRIDERLAKALSLLATEPGTVLIEEAASHVGLSPSRLRSLAGQQLSLPLSTWLIWRKLERAAHALSEGESLAAAAAIGGFADQAHLARALRRMFGITPRTAQKIALPTG